jgi:DNA gyrase/topoisomerase IV subunit A
VIGVAYTIVFGGREIHAQSMGCTLQIVSCSLLSHKDNCIEIHEIPYDTTVDAIVSKISNLMKYDNKYKQIIDVRDETGFNQETQKEEMKMAGMYNNNNRQKC